MLEEDHRLFACRYCRVNSYLTTDSYFRYILPDTAPKGAALTYFPYWRFKGMLFSLTPTGIAKRFMDVSHKAVESNDFPVSLGFRSQTQTLRFVTPGTQGTFLKPTFPFNRVMETLKKRFAVGLKGPILHQAHIGETVSMIYSPFYGDTGLKDGLTNEPISGNALSAADRSSFPSQHPSGEIHFIPTLCPGCGWDLTGSRDSLVLSCKNCETLWRSVKRKLKPVKVAFLPQAGEPVIFLPFWRIKTDISGIKLDSYEDLARLANLPKVVQKGWDKIGFRFWCPGFKVRPQNFFRIASSVTVYQPTDSLKSGIPEGRLFSVNLPVEEALESLTLNLANFVRPRRMVVDKLNTIKIRPISFILIYLPFTVGPQEYIQESIGLAINKNMIRLGENL